MNELEILLRAVKREFGERPTWQPLIQAAERELAELKKLVESVARLV